VNEDFFAEYRRSAARCVKASQGSQRDGLAFEGNAPKSSATSPLHRFLTLSIPRTCGSAGAKLNPVPPREKWYQGEICATLTRNLRIRKSALNSHRFELQPENAVGIKFQTNRPPSRRVL